MDFEELIRKTEKVDKLFKQRFDKRDRALDLVEEVGELVQAMQVLDKRKLTNDPKKQRAKADVADALADILYDLILLAEEFEIDLGSEYKKMLSSLQKRVEKGEFDENE